ncbi:MAG: pseudouridine synthase family protein, partial [Spirochaetota bacterium]
MEIIIIKETEEILMIWKPQGYPITPTKINPISFIQEIVRKKPELKDVQGYKENEYGLLNRIDNDTGGIVLIAKTNNAFIKYSRLMKEEKILKIYLALSYNKSNKKKGIISLPIAHHKKKKKKMVIADSNNEYRGNKQYCNTEFEKISEKKARQLWIYYLGDKVKFPDIRNYLKGKDKNYSFIECKIKKGKRHQIRVHLSSIGYPIVGDRLYSSVDRKNKIDGLIKHHQLFSIG